MAYENLKNAIKQVIKQNGNQEITGPILQSTLLNIVNNIPEVTQTLGNDNSKVLSQKASSDLLLHSDELIFAASAKVLGLFIKSGISIGNTIDTKSFTKPIKDWGISVLALTVNASVSYKQSGFGKNLADTVYVTDMNFKVIYTKVLQSMGDEISYKNNTSEIVFIFINSYFNGINITQNRIKFTGVVFDASSYVYDRIFTKSELPDISMNNAQSYSSFKAIYKFGVIGDSLSVGHMTNPKTGVTNSRNLKFSWGQILARKNSQICLNFGFSGATTETFFTNTSFKPSEKLVEQENKCQAYICAMGANYEPAGVGTITDINDDNPELNAKTFYGQYGRILQLIHNTFADSIVFCIPLTYPRKNDSRNNAIKAICDKFKSFAYYIDLDKYNDFIKNNLVGTVITEGKTYSKFYYDWHYTAAGYALYGDIIEKAISNYMVENADSNFNSIGQITYGSNDVIN